MNLGNLMASLSLNTAAFTAGCQAAINSARNMSSNVNGSLSTISNQARQSTRDITNASVALENIGRTFVASAIVTGLYQIGKASIMANIQMQALEVQFKAVFGSAKAGAREWEDISEMSKKWGLDLRQTADDYAKFMAAANMSPIAGEKAKQAFEGISIGITGLHLNAEKAGRVFLQLQQMLSKGKVQAEELRVIAESLPGTYGMMANALGITGAELAIRMRKGTQDAASLVEALGKELRKTYGDAAVEAATKGQATINNFKTAIFETSSAIGGALMPGFQAFTKWLSEDGVGIVKIWLSWILKASAAASEMILSPSSIKKKAEIDNQIIKMPGMAEDLKVLGVAIGHTFTERGEALRRKMYADAGVGVLKEMFDDIDRQVGLVKDNFEKSQKELDEEAKKNADAKRKEADFRNQQVRDAVSERMESSVNQFLSTLKGIENSNERAFSVAGANRYQKVIADVNKTAATLKDTLNKTEIIKVQQAGVGGQTVRTSLSEHQPSLVSKAQAAVDAKRKSDLEALWKDMAKEREDYLKELDRQAVLLYSGPSVTALQEKIAKIPSVVEAKLKDQFEVLADMTEEERNKFWKDVDEAEAKIKEDTENEFLNRTSRRLTDDLNDLNVQLKSLVNSTGLDDLAKAIANAGAAIDKTYNEEIQDLEKLGEKGKERLAQIEQIKKAAMHKPVAEMISSMFSDQNSAFNEFGAAGDANKERLNFIESKRFSFNPENELSKFDFRAAQKAIIEPKIDMLASQGPPTEEISNYIDNLIDQANRLGDIEFELFKEEDLARQLAAIEKAGSMVTTLGETVRAMEGPLADALAQFAETGELQVKEFAKSLLKSLQLFAAQKTAHMLIEAGVAAATGLAYSMSLNTAGQAPGEFKKAAEFLQGALIPAAIVAGSGLAGMAHSGIDNIPEDGTWLLKQNERVVDDRTNKDLKTFLSEDKSRVSTVNMPITINGGDEQGVMKAIPQLKQMILTTVRSDIANGGGTLKTIQKYA